MDYRRTKYCPELIDIQQKKNKVEDLIKTAHTYAKDMHSYISNNSQKFKIEFIKAYNGKCAYCGASIDLIKKSEFEIDHFLYEKAPVFATKKDAGYIDNLILACHDCNHNKNAFWVDEEGFDELYPDGEKVKKVFIRDELYYIRINDEYKEKAIINEFLRSWNCKVPRTLIAVLRARELEEACLYGLHEIEKTKIIANFERRKIECTTKSIRT